MIQTFSGLDFCQTTHYTSNCYHYSVLFFTTSGSLLASVKLYFYYRFLFYYHVNDFLMLNHIVVDWWWLNGAETKKWIMPPMFTCTLCLSGSMCTLKTMSPRVHVHSQAIYPREHSRVTIQVHKWARSWRVHRLLLVFFGSTTVICFNNKLFFVCFPRDYRPAHLASHSSMDVHRFNNYVLLNKFQLSICIKCLALLIISRWYV